MLCPAKAESVTLRLGDLLIVGIPGRDGRLAGDEDQEPRPASVTGAKNPVIGGLADQWISYMLARRRISPRRLRIERQLLWRDARRHNRRRRDRRRQRDGQVAFGQLRPAGFLLSALLHDARPNERSLHDQNARFSPTSCPLDVGFPIVRRHAETAMFVVMIRGIGIPPEITALNSIGATRSVYVPPGLVDRPGGLFFWLA